MFRVSMQCDRSGRFCAQVEDAVMARVHVFMCMLHRQEHSRLLTAAMFYAEHLAGRVPLVVVSDRIATELAQG